MCVENKAKYGSLYLQTNIVFMSMIVENDPRQEDASDTENEWVWKDLTKQTRVALNLLCSLGILCLFILLTQPSEKQGLHLWFFLYFLPPALFL